MDAETVQIIGAVLGAAVTLGTLFIQGHYHMAAVAAMQGNGGNGQVEPPLGPTNK